MVGTVLLTPKNPSFSKYAHGQWTVVSECSTAPGFQNILLMVKALVCQLSCRLKSHHTEVFFHLSVQPAKCTGALMYAHCILWRAFKVIGLRSGLWPLLATVVGRPLRSIIYWAQSWWGACNLCVTQVVWYQICDWLSANHCLTKYI